ncbi:unnamed protein product [Sympodiomycopsis kandeliae]
MTERSGLLALPYGLLTENLLPYLQASDLVKLRAVCKPLKDKIDDEVLWRNRIEEDFNFPRNSTARVNGFQTLYRGLVQPRIFVWGDKSNCRLGVRPSQLKEELTELISNQHGVPFPISVDYSQAGSLEKIGSPIEIVSGGWSFHVLTSKGEIVFWGQLDGGMWSGLSDLADPHTRVESPTLLKRSTTDPVKSVSSGRSHAVALTSQQDILEWHNWSRAIVHEPLLIAPDIHHSELDSHVEQVEAGWDFTVALIHHQQATNQAQEAANARERTSQVVYWHNDWVTDDAVAAKIGDSDRVELHGVRRVTLPPLPSPSQTVLDEMQEEDNSKHQLITKIGAGDQWVVALTASGLIYRLQTSLPNAMHDRHASHALSFVFSSGAACWRLMDKFCLPSRISQLPVFKDDEQLQNMIKPSLRITHISAQFRNFVAYTPADASGEAEQSSSVVLLGGGSDTPEVKKELQGIGVVKISVGDWHFGALTASGKVFTWGAWSKGALGTWDSLPFSDRQQQLQRGTPTGPVNRLRQVRGPARRGMPFGRIGFGGRGMTGGGSQSTAPGRPATDAGEEDEVSYDSPTRAEEVEPVEDVWQQRMRARIVPRQDGIPVPTEVVFDPEVRRRIPDRDYFAFNIAFAGWHSAAITIEPHLVNSESNNSSALEVS